MSDDLRERVARAIAESDGYDHLQDWQDKLSECQRQDYLANADAALAEMGGVQNQLDEAINQLDSARHSVDVLERRIAEMGGVRVSERTARELRDAVDMAELDYQSEVEDAASTGERPDLWLWEVGIPLPCAQEILAAIEPAPQEPEKYTIGDLTMARVFRAAGLTNVSDMQAVFDQVEVAFGSAVEPAPSVREAARVVLDAMRIEPVHDVVMCKVRVTDFCEALRAIAKVK